MSGRGFGAGEDAGHGIVVAPHLTPGADFRRNDAAGVHATAAAPRPGPGDRSAA